ncbi:MAG: hypothetical protein RJQ14_27550 [Marinoscillum sp.]
MAEAQEIIRPHNHYSEDPTMQLESNIRSIISKTTLRLAEKFDFDENEIEEIIQECSADFIDVYIR